MKNCFSFVLHCLHYHHRVNDKRPFFIWSTYSNSLTYQHTVYRHRTLQATNFVSSHPTCQTVKTWKLVLHPPSQGDRTSETIMPYIVFTFVLWASSALFAFFSAFSLAASWSTIETKVYVLNNACLRDVNYNLQNHYKDGNNSQHLTVFETITDYLKLALSFSIKTVEGFLLFF